MRERLVEMIEIYERKLECVKDMRRANWKAWADGSISQWQYSTKDARLYERECRYEEILEDVLGVCAESEGEVKMTEVIAELKRKYANKIVKINGQVAGALEKLRMGKISDDECEVACEKLRKKSNKYRERMDVLDVVLIGWSALIER